MWERTIHINGPYCFEQALRRLAIDPLNQIDLQEQKITVPLQLNNAKSVAILQGIGTVHEPAFHVQGNGAHGTEEVMKRLTEIFQWNTSLQEVEAHFTGTDLEPIFAEHRGTPLVLEFDLFRCILRCIIHQQLNMAFAHTLSSRFVHTFGTKQDGTWFYPDPETVANLKVEQLRELQFSGRKAEYVIGVAQLVVDGKLDFSTFPNLSNEEIHDQLIKVRGVGPWTIENFLMFGLGRTNLFPKRDIGIQNALKKLYQLDRKPTNDEMDRYSRRWEPYLSYASLYLWRTIE